MFSYIVQNEGIDMKIQTDYVSYSKPKSVNNINFKAKLPTTVTKTIYPEAFYNALETACAKIKAELNIGGSIMSETEKFIKLRDKFSIGLEAVNIKEGRAGWNFYTSSTPENLKAYEEVQDEITELFSNREVFDEFNSIDRQKLPKHEQKQLKDLLLSFEERLNSGELFKALEKKENEIAQKYNSYVPTIDGKEVTKVEISQILQTEKDPEIRQKAYEALIKGGDLIANDMVEFVKLRNEFAKSKGYDNFFEYKLKEGYDTDIEFLDKLISEVYSGAENKIKHYQDIDYSELKSIFKTTELQGYHYGLLTDSTPDKAVNEILEYSNIEEIAKKAYNDMGYDIDKLISDGKLTLDLYPRKGKNTHGFSFGIEAGKDTRILANLRNDARSLDTLCHEMGHSMYDLGLSSSLPIVDKCPASSAFTEAIAMMMGDIQKKENILKGIVPDNILEPFKQSLAKDEANFISKSLLIIDFEREFYRNPNQNPAKLWRDLRIKYRNQNHAENNEWATIPHYLSHPAYYQNYFRASLMKAQIYKHLKSVLGNLTENSNTAKYLEENIFSKGASIEEYDLIKLLTGKEFSAKDYIELL